MPAPEEVIKLVRRFEENRAAYHSASYNETQVRREFIDPFFRALGWDVANESGTAEAYKDVIHEYSIKIGDANRAPDYCFMTGGDRSFFVEAKRPSVNLKEGIDPAFQLRRYAWSANLPLSILTDFEELAVYDCRIRPDKADKAATAREFYIPYTDYADQWERIAALFSKEAVLGGSLDAYAESLKTKKGVAAVDDAFLQEIESWRQSLAQDIATRNPQLTQRELNFSVQMTIDRFIFLRICEDRGIEPYGRLQDLLKADGVYPRLCQLFRQADDRYNSGLFHFRVEKGRADDPDDLTLTLKVGDEPLKRIIGGTYYPDSPYEFSVLPVEILGQVYEQFLGKVIYLTDEHQAHVEDKPEVRKAGGVYYTPAYIVDTIVRETVGKLVDGKTPRQVARLKILDPACGSGSFLIGAYQYLLEWHRYFYHEDGPEKHKRQLYQGPGGDWRLTTDERRRILLNNIYGVDIDSQAVEVTKLALSLKVLEGENEQTLIRQLQLFQERALPDLGNNIKCGNSLVTSDFYEAAPLFTLTSEEQYLVNAFDWDQEFPAIMAAGGFDAVIGNPPYVRIQAMKEWAAPQVEYFKRKYRSASRGNYDLYAVFVERGLSLLNKSGRLGFILPNKLFNAEYGEPLRELMAAGGHVSAIVHFGDQQVFPRATTYTALLFLTKQKTDQLEFTRVPDIRAWRLANEAVTGQLPAAGLSAKAWNFHVGSDAALATRLLDELPPLRTIADIYVGVQTSADDVFILEGTLTPDGQLVAQSKALQREVVLEPTLVLPVVSGVDVKRYGSLPSRQWIVFPYTVSDGTAVLTPWAAIAEQAPATAAYLKANEARLRARERGKFDDDAWYRFGRNQNIGIQTQPKVCVPRLVSPLRATFDSEGRHCLDNVDVNGVVFKPQYAETSQAFLLALLNSRVLRWLFPKVSAPFRGGYWSANRQFLGQLPIRLPDLTSAADRKIHAGLVQLVGQVMQLRQAADAARTAHERTMLRRQMQAAEQRIDQLVYELYELSDTDIAIIEQALSREGAAANSDEESTSPVPDAVLV
jgi:hypothetical protein